MPVIFHATKPENWADGIRLAPAAGHTPDGVGVPQFALLEIGGPDPVALVLSVVFLSALVTLSIVLAGFHRVTYAERTETVSAVVMAPDAPALPKGEEPQKSKESTESFPQTAEPVSADPPTPELAENRPSSAPVQPSRPEPLRPTPLQADPTSSDPVSNEPLPRELMEFPPPIIPTAKDREVAKTTQPVVPPQTETPKVSAVVTPPVLTNVAAPNHKPASDSTATLQTAGEDTHKPAPGSLGAVPLAELLDDEAGLAAGLSALPSTQRLNLPRVSIRVNAEWFAALPQTQERLYFSINPPQANGEVLAYVPSSHSFDLERPERPLWQIRGGERVPALAELRAAAGRWLGVSPELVGLYTWHPPVLENALKMFVLERMQELHVQLGPRDVVTVRLASGSQGAVMNLEPIREGDSR
jgi:hypothetical protein